MSGSIVRLTFTIQFSFIRFFTLLQFLNSKHLISITYQAILKMEFGIFFIPATFLGSLIANCILNYTLTKKFYFTFPSCLFHYQIVNPIKLLFRIHLLWFGLFSILPQRNLMRDSLAPFPNTVESWLS